MSKFNCFLFWQTPPIKLKLELYLRGGLLIVNHLDQSFWTTNQKYWTAVRSNLFDSFLEVHNCVAHFTRHDKLCEFGAEKPISWNKAAHFDLFQTNFTVWSRILSTVGDAHTTFFCATFSVKHWQKLSSVAYLEESSLYWACLMLRGATLSIHPTITLVHASILIILLCVPDI